MFYALLAAADASPLNILRTVILIVEAVLAVVLIVSIFFQPANSSGISALDNQDTYYSKNKKKSIEGFMKRLTIIVAIIMAVLEIAFFFTLIYDHTGV